MSEDERKAVIAALPSEIPVAMPEGDLHRIPKERALEQLRDWYRRNGRQIYLSSELPVYYPDEKVFSPDVLAVLDVSPHLRERWVVSAEHRGLDFALEVHVHGDAKKDREENVVRYARLGIPEYFLFEPLRSKLVGYRLADNERRYTPIVPQAGRWRSNVLGLDLAMEAGRVRFYSGAAPLPDAEELIGRLDAMVNEAVMKGLDLQRQLDEALRLAAQETLEKEAARAASEAARAENERLAAKLRALGVDPDDLSGS